MEPESTANRSSKSGASSPKYRGPIMLRRDRKTESTTTDQRLLEQRGPSDWVHTDPWRVLRIQSEFVEGFGALAEVPRAVTVFGSARTKVDHPEYQAVARTGCCVGESWLCRAHRRRPGGCEVVRVECVSVCMSVFSSRFLSVVRAIVLGMRGTRAVRAYRFALDSSPDQERMLRSHCGAQRFAFNWGLALIKAKLDQREAERSYVGTEDLW